MALLKKLYPTRTANPPEANNSKSHDSVRSLEAFYGSDLWLISDPHPRFKNPPLVIVFASKESKAAKSLIQVVFLLCSCVMKVTVVEILIPDELISSANAGLNT